MAVKMAVNFSSCFPLVLMLSLPTIQEGTSKFATLEINPKRAQKRQQQQREMVSGCSRVPMSLLSGCQLSADLSHPSLSPRV